MTPLRRSGILLHVTSLPGPHGSGDLGPAAFHFVDWLAAGGQTLWQILPLGGIGPGNSPYMSPSAFAGNELLIDLAQLRDDGGNVERAHGGNRNPVKRGGVSPGPRAGRKSANH